MKTLLLLAALGVSFCALGSTGKSSVSVSVLSVRDIEVPWPHKVGQLEGNDMDN